MNSVAITHEHETRRVRTAKNQPLPLPGTSLSCRRYTEVTLQPDVVTDASNMRGMDGEVRGGAALARDRLTLSIQHRRCRSTLVTWERICRISSSGWCRTGNDPERLSRYAHKIRFVSARNVREGEASKNCVSFRVDSRTRSTLLRKPRRLIVQARV